MLGEALAGAGWVNQLISVRATVDLRVGVAQAPVGRSHARSWHRPLPGGPRSLGEHGTTEQGMVWQHRVGPLDSAAVRGYRLVEGQARLEKTEAGEDEVFTAAVRGGWLSGDPEEIVDIPDVRIAIRVARRNPTWEVFAAVASGDAPPAASTSAATPTSPRRERIVTIPQRELLARALAEAARAGDPNPELIQHAWGTRFEVTRTTGSVVFSDAPSCIFVMQGRFSAPRPRRPSADQPDTRELFSYPFQILVFDAGTGRITDSGGARVAPDLASLENVVSDQCRAR